MMKRTSNKTAYLFIGLPIVLLLVFMVIPVCMSFYYSFTNYDVVSRADFVGISNYKKIFQDRYFFIALKNTFVYTITSVPLGIISSLGAALLLNMKKSGTTLFRTFFYLPVLCSAVATANIWAWLLNPQSGLINNFLRFLGINGPAWLYDARWAMLAVIIMSVWMSFGSNMIIFLAGLQGVPENLYEASRVEGANRWQIFYYVTWPMISKTTFLVSTTLIINCFQVFDQAYMLTKGGPGNATMTLVYYIYNNGFGSLKMGYATALSVVLFIIIFTLSYINKRGSERG